MTSFVDLGWNLDEGNCSNVANYRHRIPYPAYHGSPFDQRVSPYDQLLYKMFVKKHKCNCSFKFLVVLCIIETIALIYLLNQSR